MIFIAEHWQDFSMLAFVALAGVILIVRGVRGLIAQKRGGSRVQ